MALFLKELTDALGQSPVAFQTYVDKSFMGNLERWKVRGGASKSERKRAIQEAVDALQVYKTLDLPNADEKKARFAVAFKNHYKRENLPPVSPNTQAIAADMKAAEARYNILLAKFMLLDYWQAVATGATEPDFPEDGAHWSLHFFLNYDPLKVRPILELLLDDAKSVLSKRWHASFDKWAGATARFDKSYTKDHMSTVIKVEAEAKAGVELKGEFEMEYTGFKMKASGELFAGARAQASGEIEKTATSFSAKGSVEADVGIRIKGSVNLDVLDILEVGAEVDALAGALATADAEFTVSATGVKAKVGAEVFAGAKLTGSATGKLKIGGRPILTAKASGSVSAGVGATAGAHFECDIFGKVSMGAKAGATLGVGADGEADVTIEFGNIKWGAANLFWAYVSEKGFKNKGKVWLLPVEENTEMCKKARDALFQLLGDVYRQNGVDCEKLERWNRIRGHVTKQLPVACKQSAARNIFSRLRRP